MSSAHLNLSLEKRGGEKGREKKRKKERGREEERKERREAGKGIAANSSCEMGLKRGKGMLRNMVPWKS